MVSSIDRATRMRRARARGRKAEYRVAGFFGTVRTPLSGGNSRHTRSDTLHGTLFIEVKARASHPLRRWYEALEAPLVVLDDKRAGWLVVTHSKHWNTVRHMGCKEVFNEPEASIERARTETGSLLVATEKLALKEGKVPMVCLVDYSIHGFLICVQANWWDQARKEGGDVED